MTHLPAVPRVQIHARMNSRCNTSVSITHPAFLIRILRILGKKCFEEREGFDSFEILIDININLFFECIITRIFIYLLLALLGNVVIIIPLIILHLEIYGIL